MALCNVFVERILPEIDHNHYFGMIQRKAIFWKICFRKNLPMGVCHTQGYIVQPPNLRFFGHSSLTLSKYGGGVFYHVLAYFILPDPNCQLQSFC